MGHETTRISLLSRVRNLDDNVAWREFDDRYRDLILRYCARRGLQVNDAEDVRQMVMLNLAKQLRTFQYDKKKGRFRAYLGMTVANAIHRYYRSPRPERQGLDTHVAEGLMTDDVEDRDREWELEWMLHHYRLALDSVRSSADKKSVEIFEHLLAGETPDQVAAAFDMNRDAVHKVKQRMRDRLKAVIARQIDEEEDVDTRAVS